MLRFLHKQFRLLMIASSLVVSAVAQESTPVGTAELSSAKSSGVLAPNVSPFNGSLSTAYPIELPPGRGGEAPKLMLMYNSAGGNGNCGVGWSLDVPYIDAVGLKKDLPDFSTSNYKPQLHLGGGVQELAMIEPNSYRTKTESFMSFGRYAQTFSTNVFWRGQDINGVIYRFGYGTDSKLKNYPPLLDGYGFLSEVVDPQGNYASYQYETTTDMPELIKVSWGGNKNNSTPHLYSVDIEYESRSDITSSARNGTGNFWYQRRRIKQFIIKHQLKILWVYKLSYIYSSSTSRSILTSIIKENQDGKSFTPPVKFEYTNAKKWMGGGNLGFVAEAGYCADAAGTPIKERFIEQFAGSSSQRDLGMRLMDLDGDALPDITVSRKKDGVSYRAIYKNMGNNIWKAQAAGYLPPPPSEMDFTVISGDNTYDQGVRPGDVNGDGLPDLVKLFQDNGTVIRRVYINRKTYWENQSTAWTYSTNCDTEPIVFSTNFSEPVTYGAYRLVLIDVNGDGYDDLVRSADGSGSTCRAVFLNNRNNQWIEMSDDWDPPVDFSKRVAGTNTARRTDEGVRFSDINGDGLADIVQSLDRDGQKIQGIYLNKGKGWVAASSENFALPQTVFFVKQKNFNDYPNYREEDTGARLLDINQDGLPDLTQYSGLLGFPNFGYNFVYLNANGQWQPKIWQDYLPYYHLYDNSFFVKSGGQESFYDNGTRIGDVNGDGIVDIVTDLWVTYNNPSIPNPAYFSVVKSSGSTLPDLITSIINSSGGKTDIVYKPSTAYRSTIGTNIMPAIMQVVSEVTSSSAMAGQGSDLRTIYSYAGAKFDAIEREFMGFREVTVKTQDVISSATLGSTVTTYHQTIDKAGKPEKVATYNASNKQIDQVDFSYLADGAAPYFTPLQSQIKTYFNLQNYDGNVTQTINSESHTLNGLPIKVSEINIKTDKGIRHRVTETRYAFEHHPDAGIRQALVNTRRLAQPYETVVYDVEPQTNASVEISRKQIVLNATTLLPDAEQVWDAERNLWISGSTVISRNEYGTVLETEDIDGMRTVAKLGHKSRVPIATISNATNAETFVEDFDDGRVDDNEPVNWSGAGGQWRTDQTATLRQVDKTIESICRVTQPISFPQDFIAEFDVRILRANNEDGSYWAAFRFKKANYADAWESGNILFLRKNGVVELWSPTAQLAVGNSGGSTSEWRHLRILGVGSNIKVFADGVLVIDRNDVPVASGGYFDFLTYQTESEFDNLRIYPAKAFCTSQSYDAKTLLPKRGTDALGISTYTTYDALYRPIYTRNHEGLIVAEQEAVLSRDLNGGNFSATNPNRATSVAYPTGQTSPALNNLNPVLNASFEAGTENGLPKFWQVPINLSVSVASSEGHTSPNAMRITTNGANGYVHGLFYDPDYLKPNTSYRISFWAKRTDGPNTIDVYAYLMRDDDVGTAEVFTNPPAFMPVSGSGWQYYQATLTTNNNPLWNAYQSMIRIDVHQNGEQSFLLIDDVRVERVNTGMPSDASVSMTYTDGLGRTLQTHQRDGDYDQVSKVEYDGFGRAIKQYVPNRIYNPSHTYLTNFTVSGDYGSRPYSETIYRAEPQSRASQQIPAGATDNREYSYSDYGVSALSGGYFETAPYSYSEGRNTVSSDNKLSISRSYTDRWGRTVKTVSGFGSTNEISSSTLYDILDRPVKMRDPRGMESVMTYNFLGQLVAKTTPDAGTSRYIYDKAGRLRFSQDAEQAAKSPMQQFSYFSYDMMGRMTEEGYGYIVSGDWASNRAGLQATADAGREWPAPLPNNWRKRSFYDDIGTQPFSKGSLIKMQTNNDDDDAVEVEETFSYDKYGRTTAKTIWVYDYDGGAPHTTRYSYDLAGRVTKITYPSSSGTSPQSQPEENEAVIGETTEAAIPPPVQMAFEVTYGYDVLGRLAKVGKPGDPTYFSTYGYRSDGAMTSENLRRGSSSWRAGCLTTTSAAG